MLRAMWVTLLVLVVLAMIPSRVPKTGNFGNASRSTMAVQAKVAQSKWKADVEQKTKPSPWNYTRSKDEMRSAEVSVAYVLSTKLLEFDFPYRGGSTVTLNLSKRQGETNIWLNVDRGQFLCYQHGVGEIKAKFDDGKIMDFRCIPPSGASSTAIFIEPEGRFLAALKKSKKLIVEVTFFQEGTRQIPFDTAGLVWK